mgnify:CR=1 FL=1
MQELKDFEKEHFKELNKDNPVLIDDEEVSICVECEEAYPDMIEDYEYKQNQKDFYNEY